MVIEEIVPQLPKKLEKIKKSYKNCSNLGKFTTVNQEEFSAHLEKAKSDLANVESDFRKQSWDRVIIKSYYSTHHAINALLIRKKGFYSKDHICAILALKFFEIIPQEIYDVRKWKQLSKKDAESIYLLAKEIVAFAERECYK